MFLISNAVKAQEYNCFALDDDSHGASKFCAGVPEMFSLTRQCYRWRKLFWCLAVVSLRSDVNGSFIDCLTLCCNLLTRCSRFSAELLNIHTSKSAERRGMVRQPSETGEDHSKLLELETRMLITAHAIKLS